MNVNRILGISIAVLGVWAGAGSAFTLLFDQHTATVITTVAGLAVATLGAVIGVNSSQTNQIAQVRAMPGVENIEVNNQASPALAKLAVDPTIDKVSPIAGAKAQLQEIAKAS